MKPVKGVKNASVIKTGNKKAVTQKTALFAAVKSSKNGKTTTIEAKIDVGFGNALFLRGKGRGLNWERGVPLTCVDGKTWRWSTEGSEGLVFKLLLNDVVWSKGEDLVVAAGETLEVAPKF